MNKLGLVKMQFGMMRRKKRRRREREREKRELIPSEVERRGWSMSQAYKRRMILQKYAQHEPKKLGEVPWVLTLGVKI